MRVIDEAHREAQGGHRGAGDLVRGLHPAVLEDRGLDAALSGLVARAPLPVRVRGQPAQRPSRHGEAVAYFVVSEALTNVTKHAMASRADGGPSADPGRSCGSTSPTMARAARTPPRAPG